MAELLAISAEILGKGLVLHELQALVDDPVESWIPATNLDKAAALVCLSEPDPSLSAEDGATNQWIRIIKYCAASLAGNRETVDAHAVSLRLMQMTACVASPVDMTGGSAAFGMPCAASMPMLAGGARQLPFFLMDPAFRQATAY